MKAFACVLALAAATTIFAAEPSKECKKRYEDIDYLIKMSNHCDTDSDCAPLMLGAGYIEFGCYHYVHKSVDQKKIYAQLDAYIKAGCNRMINDCGGPPKARCVAG
jgi:hypothetical protein